MKRTLLVLLVLAALTAACGQPTESTSVPGGAPGGGAPGSTGSGTPINSDTDGDGSQVHDIGGGKAQRVEPRSGMDGLHRVGWERIKQLGERRIDVYYWSGVEPCYVLDHYDVEYRPRSIVVSLFEGHDPKDKDAACIEIAVYKVVRIQLEEFVDGRDFVDGARAYK